MLEGEGYVVKNTTFMMLPYLLSLAQENVFIFRKALSPWMSEQILQISSFFFHKYLIPTTFCHFYSML